MIASISYIQQVANSLLGISYIHFGRDPDIGLDCLGLLLEFFKRLGIPITGKETAVEYEEDWWKKDNFVEDGCNGIFEKIENPWPGDIILTRTDKSVVPNHLCIMLNNGDILNADRYVGIHVLKFYAIKDRVHSFYRHKGLSLDVGDQ